MAQEKVAEEPTKAASSKAWSGFQAEVISISLQLTKIFGQPNSNAEIHGGALHAPEPMTMDGVTALLPAQHD